MSARAGNHKGPLLEVRDLHAGVAEVEILKGLDLTVNLGDVHAVMGPNGSGKSTLANVLAGKPEYKVTAGEVIYEGSNLLKLTPDQRALDGIFLAFQYPVELPGVREREFMKTALDTIREHRGLEKLSVREFNKLFQEKIAQMEMSPDLVKRSVNEGFSGGEKKRNEIVPLAVLEPKLALLDETDSGLDIDALKIVADGVNKLRGPSRAIVIVTHYQRILDYIKPDFVHVLIDGRIVRSGGPELALELEAKGYEWIKDAVESGERLSV